MNKKLGKISTMMLTLGLSCTFLLSGCVGAPSGKTENKTQDSMGYTENGGTVGVPPASGEQSGNDVADVPEAADWYIRTDAQIYFNGTYNAAESWLAGGTDSQQTIYITAGGGKDAYVGIYRADDTSFRTPVKGYLLAEAEGFRYALPAKDLAEGDYVAALFPAEGASVPRATSAFSVTDGAVFTNKSLYLQNEQIVFTFYANTTDTSSSEKPDQYSWIGLYKKQDVEGYGGDYLKWVKLCGNQLISGRGYILQENKVGSVGWSGVYPARATNVDPVWEPGAYELVLFGDGGYGNVLSKAEFTVVAGRTGKANAPDAVQMNVFGTEDGVLSGEVICSFAPERMNASEIVAYWADENGVLADYLPFGAQRVTGNPQRYYAFENIMIPEGATNLRFYGKNADGIGNSYFRVDLPAGSTAFSQGELLSEFTYLSDIHVGYTDYKLVDGVAAGTEVVRNSNNYKTALDDVKAVSGENSDGIFIVGDVTESGRPEEWTLVSSIAEEKGFSEKIYYMLGNHDYYGVYDRGDWQAGVPYSEAVKPFTDWVLEKTSASAGSMTADESGLWYEAEISGVHHLVLNTEEADGDWVCAHLSEKQLSWLDTRLSALKAEGKTAFVYLHQPLTDTTAGTMPGEGWDHVKIIEEGGLVRDAAPLKDILDKYSNAFFVSGHNHRELDAYRVVFPASTAQHNTFIQTGGTAYIDKETTPGVNLRHEGWYVRVYSDRVVLLGREFTTGKWLSGACYVFDLK